MGDIKKYTFTPTRDVTLTASFASEIQQHTVTIQVEDGSYSSATYQYKVGSGSWTSLTARLFTFTVDQGTVVSVRATGVSSGKKVVWTVSGSEYDTSTDKTINEDVTFYAQAKEETQMANVKINFQDTASANAASYYYRIGASGTSTTIQKDGTTFTAPNGSTLYIGMTNGNMDSRYSYTRYISELDVYEMDTIAGGDVTSAEIYFNIDQDQEDISIFVRNLLYTFEIRPASASEGAVKVRWKMTGKNSSDSKPWTTSASLTTSMTDTFRQDKIESIELEVTSVKDETDNHYRFKQISVATDDSAPTTYGSQSISITNLKEHSVVATVECTRYYAVTVVQAENGSITPTGVVLVVAGQSETFTFTPAANHKVETILLDGDVVQPDS